MPLIEAEKQLILRMIGEYDVGEYGTPSTVGAHENFVRAYDAVVDMVITRSRGKELEWHCKACKRSLPVAQNPEHWPVYCDESDCKGGLMVARPKPRLVDAVFEWYCDKCGRTAPSASTVPRPDLNHACCNQLPGGKTCGGTFTLRPFMGYTERELRAFDWKNCGSISPGLELSSEAARVYYGVLDFHWDHEHDEIASYAIEAAGILYEQGLVS